MQNLLLLHLREQKKLSLKEVEQRTGISKSQYLDYEQGASISATDVELLSCLFKIQANYLQEYSHQLEYFAQCKSMLEIKDKRVEQLVTVLKHYIGKEQKPKKAKKLTSQK